MSSLWMIEFERVLEDLDSEKIGPDEAISRFKSLGLDPEEAEETVDMHLTGVGG